MSRFLRSLATIAVIAAPAALGAQAVPSPAGASMPTAKNQVISIQPLSAMLTVYAGEFERRVSPTMTLGVGATHFSGFDDDEGDDVNYTSGDVKLRYYPGAQAFQGFSFGAQVGYTRVSDETIIDFATGETEEHSAGGPTFGVALDYSWLLGGSKAFYVGLGVGAKALFIDEDEFDEDVTRRYPTARISVGYAF